MGAGDRDRPTQDNQLDVTPEEFQLFVEEGDEQLQEIEDLLLALEAGQAGPEEIDRLFRAAHTLKGNSATVGFRQLASLTHAFESLFDQARKGQLVLAGNGHVIDLLLRSLDVLRALLNDGVKNGGQEVPNPAANQLEQELRALSAHSTPPNRSDTHTGGTEAAATPPASATPSHAAAAPTGSLPSWRLHVQLAPDCGLPAVRIYQLFTRASEWGQILTTDPPLEAVEQVISSDSDQDAIWRRQPITVRLTSSLTAAQLKKEAGAIPEVASVTVEPEAWSPSDSPPAAAPEAPGSPSAESAPAVPPPAQPSRTRAPSPSPASGRPGDRSALAAVEASTIRVNVQWLDLLMNLVGELVIDRNRLLLLAHTLGGEHTDRVSRAQPAPKSSGADRAQGSINHVAAVGDDEISQLAAHLSRLTGDLQDAVMQLRMVPIDSLFRKLPRVIRETARLLGKQIRLEITGNDTQLDRSLIDELHDPVLHLLRNAVDHGIESAEIRQQAGKPAEGLIHVGAYHREGHFYLEVSDDGGGISTETIRAAAVRRGDLPADVAAGWSDNDLLRLLFRPGFSTSTKVTQVSGRGVGLDVVSRAVERLGGTVDVRTEVGKGTTFRIRLPLTLAIVRALLVSVGGVVCAIPLNSVTEAAEPGRNDLQMVNSRPVLRHRDDILPLFALHGLWQITPPASRQIRSSLYQLPAVIVQVGDDQLALQVDALLGEEEVVVKPFGKFLGQIPGLAGTTLLGDGRVALILDVPGLFAEVRTNASYLTA